MPERRSVITMSKLFAGAVEATKLLKKGDLIKLVTEPENKNDQNAVLCLTADDKRLGYLPRTHNTEIARLLRGGRIVHARVDDPAVVALDGDNRLFVKVVPHIEIWF
jgi:hypothetical protein